MVRAHAWTLVATAALLLVSVPDAARAQTAVAGAAGAELSSVSLPVAASFEAPDGSPVALAAGDYRLTLAEPGVLWVRPVGGGDAVRVAAAAGRHEEPLERPLAVSESGSGEQRHLALLLPGGALYEVVGSESRVSERGASRLRLPAPQVAALAQAKLRVAQIQRSMSARFHDYLADPSPARRGAFRGEVDAIGSISGGNIMATLYHVFRESILAQNEDKKYWLTKLKHQNQLGKQLADYLASLSELSRELGASASAGSGRTERCGKAADGAEGAADRLLSTLARVEASGPPAELRADLERLRRTVQRERTALREMRGLVDEVSARAQRTTRLDPVR